MALSSDLIQIGISARQADFLGDTSAVGIAASGTVQNNDDALTASVNHVESATAAVDDAITLPSAKTYKQSCLFIRNDSGETIQIFPWEDTAEPENINGLAVDTAISLTDGEGMLFFRISILNVIRWLTVKG